MPPLQSESAQQPFVPAGTQWPLLHEFEEHWSFAEHSAALAPPQVFAVSLHRPLAHTANASLQVPPCAPSLGIGEPAGKSTMQRS